MNSGSPISSPTHIRHDEERSSEASADEIRVERGFEGVRVKPVNPKVQPLINYFNLLPNDLIKQFMHKYLHPYAAVQCLMVCKRFWSLSDRWIVIRRYLQQLNYDKNFKHFKNLVKCEKCELVTNKKNYKKHLAKHAIREKQGNVKNFSKKVYVPKCESCGSLYPEKYNHKCKYDFEICHCANSTIPSMYEWVVSLCTLNKSYYPDMRNHTCKLQCIVCKSILQNIKYEDSNSFKVHYNNCPEKEKLHSLYKLHSFSKIRNKIRKQQTKDDKVIMAAKIFIPIVIVGLFLIFLKKY